MMIVDECVTEIEVNYASLHEFLFPLVVPPLTSNTPSIKEYLY